MGRITENRREVVSGRKNNSTTNTGQEGIALAHTPKCAPANQKSLNIKFCFLAQEDSI